jgi:hypothetical protein
LRLHITRIVISSREPGKLGEAKIWDARTDQELSGAEKAAIDFSSMICPISFQPEAP